MLHESIGKKVKVIVKVWSTYFGAALVVTAGLGAALVVFGAAFVAGAGFSSGGKYVGACVVTLGCSFGFEGAGVTFGGEGFVGRVS